MCVRCVLMYDTVTVTHHPHQKILYETLRTISTYQSQVRIQWYIPGALLGCLWVAINSCWEILPPKCLGALSLPLLSQLLSLLSLLGSLSSIFLDRFAEFICSVVEVSGDYSHTVSTQTGILYSRKFSRGSVFADRRFSKFADSNSWTCAVMPVCAL